MSFDLATLEISFQRENLPVFFDLKPASTTMILEKFQD